MLPLKQFMIPHLFCFQQSRNDANSRDKSDAESIIVVVIQGPQYYASDLKHVEGVYDLEPKILNRWPVFQARHPSHLVH